VRGRRARYTGCHYVIDEFPARWLALEPQLSVRSKWTTAPSKWAQVLILEAKEVGLTLIFRV